MKTSVCYTRPSTEAANTDAFVEVDEITLQGEVKRIFSGWMYAASPGLHGVEHPVYDIWLTDCKGPDQTIVSAQPDPPKPPPPPPAQKKGPPPQKQAAPRPLPPPGYGQPPPPPPTAAAAGRPVRHLPLINPDFCAAMISSARAPGIGSAARQAWKVGRLARDRAVEQGAIAAARDLDRPECAQMLGDILGVEQLEAARDQPRHQMHQRHLRGVAHAMEHALAEEGAAETDTIKPADEVAVLPDLDAVAMAELVQAEIEVADALVDPGIVAACPAARHSLPSRP